MSRLKKRIIAFFTFFGGAYFFLEFILPKQMGGVTFGAYHEEILRGVQVVGVMAIGLGLLSILRVHGGRILKKSPGAGNSAALLGGFLLMLFFQGSTVFEERRINQLRMELSALPEFVRVVRSEQTPPLPRIDAMVQKLRREQELATQTLGKDSARDALFEAALSESQKLSEQLKSGAAAEGFEAPFATAISQLTAQLIPQYQAKAAESVSARGDELLTKGLFIPLGSAMFSLLAFYIASAAYRSFRVRSLESRLLMFTAVIVMLGQIPQGSLYISEDLPLWRLWLLKNVSTPAFRAIFFGSAIAGLAMAIRIWLSLEKGPLAEEEQ